VRPADLHTDARRLADSIGIPVDKIRMLAGTEMREIRSAVAVSGDRYVGVTLAQREDALQLFLAAAIRRSASAVRR